MNTWPPRTGLDLAGQLRGLAALGLAVLLSGAGCAYFNTFYNAREHFKKAERSRATAADGESGPSAAAIREYDLTIEKCNRVIQEHGGSRWVDDAIFLMGRAYLGKQEFAQALDKFRALVNGFPDSNLRHEAMFMSGVTYYRLNREEEGRKTFDRLLRERPDFVRRDEMLRLAAEALEREGRLDEAIEVYRRVVAEFPDGERRVETLLGIGDLYMRTASSDSAYAAFDEALRVAEKIDDRLEARRRRADALFREKRYEEALDTYRTVLDIGKTLEVEQRAGIELRIAACLNALGEHERAMTEYRRIAETRIGAVAAAEATFNIGLIRELELGDYQSAVVEYDAIKRFQGAGARSVFATQAASRAQHLRRLIEQGITSREGESSNAEAAGALLLAEQFLFQQSDTARALAQYELIEERFPASGEAAKAAFGRAFLAYRLDARPDSTLSLYLHVLTEYPGTPQAIGAGDHLSARGLEHLIPAGALILAAPDSSAVDSVASGPASAEAPADTLERAMRSSYPHPSLTPDSTGSAGGRRLPVTAPESYEWD